MKKIITYFILILLIFIAILYYLLRQFQEPSPIVILHTSDVHANIDKYMGYAGLQAYKKEIEKLYGKNNIILVDLGDTIQGTSVGMLSKGEDIIDLMNSVGYDYFVFGNHEFDYKLDNFFKLTKKLDATTLATNFINLKTNKPVFAPYEIRNFQGTKIAFIGVTTPESITVATEYFRDEKGKLIYSFEEFDDGKALYENVQKNIDDAKKEGADYIVILSHLGIDETSKPWRSVDLIKNTSGIDILIDGQSHVNIKKEIYYDKDGAEVILTNSGFGLKVIGSVVITPQRGKENSITTMLVGEKGTFLPPDPEIEEEIKLINNKFSDTLKTVVAQNDYSLVATIDDVDIVRLQETNIGNLIVDAYRELLDSDIAFTNGGGIRANLEKGSITYQDIIDLHPFGNDIILVEMTGQDILDALEMGAREYPFPNPSFLQVSGMTYEIDWSVPSSVILDSQNSFIAVRGDYRVKNVKVNGEPLVLDKKYTVASHDYMLKSYGDGMTMFKNIKILKDNFMVDSDLLIKYITESLQGIIPEKYADVAGEGRIKIY